MGLFLSRSSPEWQVVCPSSVSLFDLEARFFVPTRGSRTSSRAEAVKVGRRANFAACSELARPYLDSFEHDGTLGAIGMTIEGSPLIGRADQSRHNLVSGGSKDPNHDAVIRIGSEAPGGGPILESGVEHHGLLRVATTSDRDRNRRDRQAPRTLSYLPLDRSHRDAGRHFTDRDQAP